MFEEPKVFFFVLCSIFLTNPLAVEASGAYVPNIAAHQNGLDYNKGKAIFNGRIKITERQACNACHGSRNRFKRRRLIEIKEQLADKIINCDIHSSCYQGEVTSMQLEQLVNYLITRFRLN